MKTAKTLSFALIILLLPVVGYGLMHGLIYLLPLSEHDISNIVIFSAIIIAMGLLIPMWMVKLGVHVAALNNPRKEDELQFKDIAKDKEQLARSQQKPNKKELVHARNSL